MKARTLVRRARLGSYLFAVIVVAVLALRYESMRLPYAGCSPLRQFQPGSRLLLDRWGSAELGDAVLFRGGDQLLLGRVQPQPDSLPADLPSTWEAFDEDHLWIVGDVENCLSLDSRSLGPIRRSAVKAVVAAGLPW